MAGPPIEDWQRLDPFRSLPGDDQAYVPRPGAFGFDLAGALRARLGGGRLVVVGPAGVGKSTEMAVAARRLSDDGHRVLHIAIDTTFDVRRLDDLTLLTAILQAADEALDGEAFGESIIGGLLAALVASNPAVGAAFFVLRQAARSAAKARTDSPSLAEALDGTVQALRKLGGASGIALLLDGFEKAPTERAGAALDLLVELADRADCRIAAVLAPAIVVGPLGQRVVDRYKSIELAPVDPQTAEGRTFLRTICARRLDLCFDDLDAPVRQVIDQAAALSGGLPRMFLQLLVDAAGYAALGGRSAPDAAALEDAFADQMDSQRMLLEADDLDRMRHVVGGTVDALPSDVRARYLAHGMLLLRRDGRRQRLDVHPVVRALLDDASRA